MIPAKAKPFVVCPAFEEDRARELLEAGPFGKNAEVLTWQEDENPFALAVKGLNDRGIATGTVGIDENMKFVFADSLAKAGPQLHLVSALPVTAGCRMIKDAHELDCIRLACRATLLVYRAVYQSLQEGMMTRDVRRLVQAGYQKVGFEGEASLNIGEFTASPHGSIQPQTIHRARPDDNDGRSRKLYVGHYADVVLGRLRIEVCLSCAQGAVGCSVSGESWSCALGCGRGGAQGDCGRGVWAGVQVLYASRRTWDGRGHARVVLSGEEQYVRMGAESGDATGHGVF